MEVPTDNDRQTLNYATPSNPSRLVTLAKAGSFRLALAVALFFAALLLPHPEGIWYFGPRPHWLVAIGVQGLDIGPSSGSAYLGWTPLVVLKMLVAGVPFWLIWRWVRARRDTTGR